MLGLEYRSSLTGPDAMSWKIIFTILFLMKINLVSSVTEDDYNPDYEQEGLMSLDEKWAEIPASQPSARLGLMKRHLGSLASSSGFRIHENGNGNEINSGARFLNMPGNKRFRFAPPLARTYFGSTHNNIKRTGLSEEIDEGSLDQGRFYERPAFHLNGDDEDNSMQSIKVKRFMGSLARGGWFPRQFRGLVAEPQWDKRHVGAVARLGWMPHSKNLNTRLGTEWSLKRNIGSLRKNQAWAPKGDNINY